MPAEYLTPAILEENPGLDVGLGFRVPSSQYFQGTFKQELKLRKPGSEVQAIHGPSMLAKRQEVCLRIARYSRACRVQCVVCVPVTDMFCYR